MPTLRLGDMSKKELVLVVGRALSLLFVAWALVDLTYLPERLFSLSHHISQRSVLVSADYWTRDYLIITSFLVVRIVALLSAALVLWKNGPQVQAVLGGNEVSEPTPPNRSLERR